MTDWLKSLGEEHRQMPPEWEEYRDGFFKTAVNFGRRPSMRTGDRIVYYATGFRVVFAVGVVTSLPYKVEYEWTAERPWVVDVQLSRSISFLPHAVDVGELSVAGRDVKSRMSRRSHLKLVAEEFEQADRLLAKRTST